MNTERKSPLGSISRNRRRLISRPGAIIRAEIIELTGELEPRLRSMATRDPAHRPERKRRWFCAQREAYR